MDKTLELTKNKDIKTKKITIYSTVSIFSICLIYGIIRLIKSNGADAKAILIIIESLASIVIPFLFPLVEKIFKIKIGNPIYIITLAFLFMSVTLGETLNFYENIHNWDKLLHISSGFLITFAGYTFIINSLKDLPNNKRVSLGICFSVFFALAFLMCWEIIEFTVDNICGTNMQKFIPELFLNGGGNSFIPLEGTQEEIANFFQSPAGYRYALMDTMLDLVTGLIGSITCAIVLCRTGNKFENIITKSTL